jgi:hypothetical protein
MDGSQYVQALVERGYSPVQAAALVGHIIQESNGNPAAVNPKEDAHGLIQWRGDRWAGLQQFAKERGTDPTDPQLQLDFIAREMAGPEAKAGAQFASATDLPSASAALKSYIRFGDDSAGTRLANAQRLMSGQAGMLAPPPQMASAAPTAAVPATTPTPAPTDDGGQLQASLEGISKMLAQQQTAPPTITPLQPIQAPMTPAMIRARQMAAAMRAQPLTVT